MKELIDACKKGEKPEMGRWGSLPLNGQVSCEGECNDKKKKKTLHSVEEFDVDPACVSYLVQYYGGGFHYGIDYFQHGQGKKKKEKRPAEKTGVFFFFFFLIRFPSFRMFLVFFSPPVLYILKLVCSPWYFGSLSGL